MVLPKIPFPVEKQPRLGGREGNIAHPAPHIALNKEMEHDSMGRLLHIQGDVLGLFPLSVSKSIV